MSDKFMEDGELDDLLESNTTITIVTKTGMSLKYSTIYSYTNTAICVLSDGEGVAYTIPWRNIDYIIEESE